MQSTLTVRQEHEARVLAALRDHGACSRAELSDLIGLSRSSLSEVTSGLLDRGSIVVCAPEPRVGAGAGRPPERLALDPNSGQYVGLDFQHARVDLAIADATHEVLATGEVAYDSESPWHLRLAAAYDLIDRVSAEHGLHLGALSWIYAGVPGPYVPANSQLTLSEFAQRGRVDGYGVREALAGHFGVPATIDNNTRLAALAEASAGDLPDLLYVRLGQGVGGGIVQGGRLSRGAHFLSGELGHVEVPGEDGPCRCGKRGCFETIGSLPAVVAACADAGLDATGGVLPAAHPAVDALVRRLADALSAVLSPVVMAIDPDEVVIAGPVPHLLPDLLPLCQTALRRQRFLGLDLPVVRGSRVTHCEGALGALQAGFDAAAGQAAGAATKGTTR